MWVTTGELDIRLIDPNRTVQRQLHKILYELKFVVLLGIVFVNY